MKIRGTYKIKIEGSQNAYKCRFFVEVSNTTETVPLLRKVSEKKSTTIYKKLMETCFVGNSRGKSLCALQHTKTFKAASTSLKSWRLLKRCSEFFMRTQCNSKTFLGTRHTVSHTLSRQRNETLVPKKKHPLLWWHFSAKYNLLQLNVGQKTKAFQFWQKPNPLRLSRKVSQNLIFEFYYRTSLHSCAACSLQFPAKDCSECWTLDQMQLLKV